MDIKNINNKSKRIDIFVQKIKAINLKFADLYEGASGVSIISDKLPQAIMELGSASQFLNDAIKELYQQNEELSKTQEILETQRKYYEELFEEAPYGYLVTDSSGQIKQANRTATKLFNLGKEFLIGRNLIDLVTLEQRQCFLDFFSNIKYDSGQELITRLQQPEGETFEAALIVALSRKPQDKPQTLRWQVRNITERNRTEFALKACDLESNRPVQKYCKGEIIFLNPQAICYVSKGWVKLTAFCETSEEVLIGLAIPGMVFGSDMTSLHTYQATALSDVELVYIYLSEIATSPSLNHSLLPKIKQRLQQTESFLMISGIRRLEDRFCQFLRLLKKEIGETATKETRLAIRLTHEDFANACCTTRVTITRLLCKLKQEGKIDFDVKRHMIIKDID